MEWITLIPIEILVVVVSSLITYFTARRKNRADLKELENQITSTIFSTYKSELESMKNRIDNYIKEIDELQEKVNHLVDENAKLKNELAKFKKNTESKKERVKLINHDT